MNEKEWIQTNWVFLMMIGILLIGFLLNHYAESKNVDEVITKCAEELKECGCFKTTQYNWNIPGGLYNGTIPDIKG